MTRRFFTDSNGDLWTLTELREAYFEDCAESGDYQPFDEYLAHYREISEDTYYALGGVYF